MKVILVSEQHGFSEGIYTENIPIRLTDSILKSINQNAHWWARFSPGAACMAKVTLVQVFF